MGTVLIIGTADDPLCGAVESEVRERGHEPVRLDPTREGGRNQIHLTIGKVDGGDYLLLDERRVDLDDLTGVLHRMPGGPPLLPEDAKPLSDEETHDREFAFLELAAQLQFLTYKVSCPVINRVHFELWAYPTMEVEVVRARCPGIELSAAESTLTANKELYDLRGLHPGAEDIVVRGFADPFERNKLNLWEEGDKLKSWAKVLPLRTSPYEPGEEVTVIIVGERAFSSPDDRATAVPEVLERRSREIIAALELHYGAVTWSLQPGSAPRFVRVEQDPLVPDEVRPAVAAAIAEELLP